jgi:hypothetical protein
MKVLYLDESGDHELKRIDPRYPVFVLGGVIVDRDYVRSTLNGHLRHLKETFFDDPNIILHTADIVRSKNGFEALEDRDLREKFYAALNELMRSLEYKVVACAINKTELVAQYGDNAEDPYMYSLHILVERFCKELGDCTDGGIIFAEKRGESLDHLLLTAWEDIKNSGTIFARGRIIDQRIVDLSLKDKNLNIAGLQLADLVVSPIGRKVMGKTTREDWEIVESKFRCRPSGDYKGYGLVIRPKK